MRKNKRILNEEGKIKGVQYRPGDKEWIEEVDLAMQLLKAVDSWLSDYEKNEKKKVKK